MRGPTEQEIRTRAYELWKDAGEPPGQMDQLWYKAERELLARKAANGEAHCDINGQDGPTPYPAKLRGVH
ncbi:DUF2934 domain-containing protein [Bradyrhizobium sp. CCBAU 53421]|uniref:DUF2934 domain-containing protein n=1 Tax=Bradyrhizobium sp. CCBAU 53421 TaxID=1325120 RepID=UPI00188DB3B0|nr:DUF2934 domain-containing protein [Bradyrhizobium sp. CCBAU 53421]QOZ35030.1 DUF2934 domain-containing protein [Bradyrhizobium sp. CCBAU 53421]